MKVTELVAATAVVPLRNPTSFSTRTVSERHYTLVKVRTDEGVEGLGFCYCGNRAGWLVTQAVRDLLAVHVVGRDPHDTEAIWDAMYRDAVLVGRRGAVVFQVAVDGKVAFDSGVMRGGQLPRTIHIPLRGARRVTLIVDFGPDGASAGDHADWGRAVLIRK